MYYLLIASLVWGLSFGLVKHVLVAAGMDPGFVALVRLALSALVFLPLLRVRALNARRRWALVALGAVQYGVMYVTYTYSFKTLPAHQVALFTVFTPLFVTAIHDLAERRFHALFLLAAALSVAGACVVAWTSVDIRAALTGILWLQVSNASFAFGQVWYRRLMADCPEVGDAQVFGLLYVGGTVLAAVPALFTVPWHDLQVSTAQAWTLLYLGIVPSGLGFFLWNVGARCANPGTLAVLNNAKIPLGMLLSLLVFGESASLPALAAGGALIALAVVLNERVGVRRGMGAA